MLMRWGFNLFPAKTSAKKEYWIPAYVARFRHLSLRSTSKTYHSPGLKTSSGLNESYYANSQDLTCIGYGYMLFSVFNIFVLGPLGRPELRQFTFLKI